MERKHRENAGWINDQLPNNNSLYLGAQTEPGISQPLASWNYFYLVFYKRNKSRSVLDKQWGLRLSTPLQNPHTIRIWASSLGPVSYRGMIRSLPLWSGAWAWNGPSLHFYSIKIYWAPLCSRYGVRCCVPKNTQRAPTFWVYLQVADRHRCKGYVCNWAREMFSW